MVKFERGEESESGQMQINYLLRFTRDVAVATHV